VAGQVGRGEAVGLQDLAQGRLQAGRHGQGAVAQQQLQPVAGHPRPAAGPGTALQHGGVVQLLQGEELAQLAPERRRTGRPEAAGGPVGDPGQVDLVEEGA
jgi:hypothetical protein